MNNGIEGSASDGSVDEAELREQQAAKVSDLKPFETCTVLDGFPPEQCIVTPQLERTRYEEEVHAQRANNVSDEDIVVAWSPMSQLKTKLEEMFPDHKPLPKLGSSFDSASMNADGVERTNNGPTTPTGVFS